MGLQCDVLFFCAWCDVKNILFKSNTFVKYKTKQNKINDVFLITTIYLFKTNGNKLMVYSQTNIDPIE